MALHCRLLFQIPSWNTFGTRSIRAFALEFKTGLPGYSHLSDETATQLQPPTRPGDARIASNDGDKRTDELCLLLWRRCGCCTLPTNSFSSPGDGLGSS